MLKQIILPIACFANRTLRYGTSKNRLLRYFVIRSRFYLKRYIHKHADLINDLGVRRIRLAHAGKMELQTNDYIDNWLYTGADFEPHVVSLFFKFLRKGNHVLDIGANIGYFSLIASRLVGPTGQVYAFEPTPLTKQKLQKNIQLNNANNIIVHQKAVSDRNGKAIFKVPSDPVRNSGRASFRDIEENYISVEVETIMLNSILSKLKPIQLIKIDIEGSEALALKGMEKLIERDYPVFIMELSDYYLRQLGSSAELVLEFFRAKNYKIFIAGEGLMEIHSDSILKELQYDILCVPSLKEAAFSV